jgi:dTDP-4-amino-4,6-dideoxygalactose transaminase
LSEVLESGKWWYGERVAKFEKEYAAFQDTKYCVSCTSGTVAAETALRALGVGPGDEVIVPPYTFIATASAVVWVGALPVFVDVDESWCMNPDLIEPAITERTKAVMPVHFAGRVCDMDSINAVAAKHGLTVVEDACHSWGSKWKGKGTGALGTCGVFSFQMSKNITAGEGGAILTDDEELAAKCRALTNCGRSAGSEWYEHALVGSNGRMTEFTGALLSAQLTRLEEQTLAREQNAAWLDTPVAFGCSRAKLCAAAQAEGLALGAGYTTPLYMQPGLAKLPGAPDYSKRPCPVTEDLCATSGTWFIHQILLGCKDDMKDIVDIFAKVKEHAAELAG